MKGKEDFLKTSIPVSSHSRAVATTLFIKDYKRRIWWADIIRFLNNERVIPVQLENFFPRNPFVKEEPIYVRGFTLREAKTTSFIHNDHEINWREPLLDVFNNSIFYDSCKKEDKEMLIAELPKEFKKEYDYNKHEFYNLCDYSQDMKELEYDKRIYRIPKCFQNYKKLEKLYLGNSLFYNIENLDALVELKELEMYGRGGIEKIEGIHSLKKLKKLRLRGFSIKKIKGIENLTNLEELDLSRNKIKKIDGLKNLKITDLDLSENDIEKIENLDDLPLEKLRLSSNQITKMENLATLSNLKELNLRLNYIKKVEEIDSLEDLDDLNLGDNMFEKEDCEKYEEKYEKKLFYFSCNGRNPVPSYKYLRKLKEKNII